jgi:hypothetical protein
MKGGSEVFIISGARFSPGAMELVSDEEWKEFTARSGPIDRVALVD